MPADIRFETNQGNIEFSIIDGGSEVFIDMKSDEALIVLCGKTGDYVNVFTYMAPWDEERFEFNLKKIEEAHFLLDSGETFVRENFTYAQLMGRLAIGLAGPSH